MTNNAINELKNNFEQLFGRNHTECSTNKPYLNNAMSNANRSNDFTNNHHHIINHVHVKAERRSTATSIANGDDLSNIDVKSLVSTC